ncbi:hypothetical protein SOM26_14435 [Sphingomonas sp. CFBP8993]|uniref:hypothetical protein n=1 Tax=Sphingomonas sp. CFBP8993 TaxID=3096526 RepID=UPI002A6B7CC2|nr:hypothetical protein [Sphingomonas sp. CFBP8993]MDY0959889.1 hypothetical protein [Sphingomonas sp. CFBP8993]
MSCRLTHMAIGGGIALSLLGWGTGRLGEVAVHLLPADIPAASIVAREAIIPHVSVHLSIEVRP